MSDEAEALRIVQDALDQPAGPERDAWLAVRCAGKPALRKRVEALLAHEESAFRLTPTESFVRPLGIIDAIPPRIGPYRVTREIARGGMGAVVAAERDDGVFAATVAIKLIRSDIASDRARQRFADERRILARLRHPGIVRILDGGEADQRPWLAMDLIDGKPITEALAQASLAVRLDAFEAVCDAVAFAHRNLVVHADIKPSNVLMSADKAVHLLDFGIARLMVDLDSTELGDPYPLTKGYAAPERAVGTQPTVASDVFSLGVLLLGMLGKAIPQDGTDCVAGTRLPVGQLSGDLAAIAGRALAEDPAARYPDVPALLSDIRRHRAFVPVAARADAGRSYQALRFVQRHRRGLALASLGGFALAAAALVSTLQYVRAERARDQADARFMEMRQLAQFMLYEHYDRLADAPGTVGARAQLADRAARYLDQLRTVPRAPADLRLETARGYRRLATILGQSGVSSLGRPAAARAALDRAEALLPGLDADPKTEAAVNEERGWIAASRWTLAADNAGSAQVRRNAQAAFERALALDPARSGARLGLLTLAGGRGYELIWSDNRPAEAVPVLRQALEALRTARLPRELQRQADLLEVHLLGRLGDALYYAGDPAAALGAYRQQKARVQAQLARGPSVVWSDKLGEVAFNIGGTLVDMPGQQAAALDELTAGDRALRQILAFGPDANVEKRLLVVLGQESLTQAVLGHPAEAAALSQESIDLRDARLRRDPLDPQRNRDLGVALPNHARLLAGIGQKAAACAAAARAVAVWRAIAQRGHLSARDRAIDQPAAARLQAELCR